MIAIHELRIGNIVGIPINMSWEQKPFAKVWSISSDGINETHGHGMDMIIKFSELTPIPITPEILVKCGFVKDGFNSYNMPITMFSCTLNTLTFSGDYLYLRQGHKLERGIRHKDDLCVLWNKDMMKQFYLHQLQNLIHSLTGNELTIQL